MRWQVACGKDKAASLVACGLLNLHHSRICPAPQPRRMTNINHLHDETQVQLGLAGLPCEEEMGPMPAAFPRFTKKNKAMISVSILYPNTEESRFNLDYYLTRHIPMLQSLLDPMGLEKVVVEEGLGTPMPNVPAPFSVMAHLIFNNLEEMEMSMGHHGPTLMEDVPNFTNVLPIVQISRQV